MGEAERKRQGLCWCGTGKRAGQCCYMPHGWHKTAAQIALKNTGQIGSHPRCYMNKLNSCCDKISGEHVVSEVVLRVLSEKEVSVSGFPWLKGQSKVMRFGSLTTNRLGRTHNSALSNLDSSGRKILCCRPSEHMMHHGPNQHYLVSGHDLERWLLKTLAALAVSDNLADAGEKLTGQFHPSVNVTELLEHPEQWRAPLGMYFTQRLGARFQRSDTFGLAPLTIIETGELAGMLVDIQGLSIALLVAPRPIKGTPLEGSSYRPGALNFQSGRWTNSILLSWDDPHKHGHLTMTFER